MTEFWPYLLALAVIIIASLGFYAGKLIMQLKQQTIAQQQAEEERQAALKVHDKKILDSVVIIVRAMKEEQCDVSEGCWRLSVLLDSLKTSSQLDQEFPAIFEMYNAIKHMPILEERKKLAKRDRMKLDLERAKVEARLSGDIFLNLDSLHQYANERLSVISS
jgi:hypothetical protein